MENYDYGLIGNCVTAALVSKDCSIDWLCLPFFDSSSLFGKILDKDKGGFFKITAEGITNVEQHYLPNTAILLTRFETTDGIFEVRDYMPRFKRTDDIYYCPPEVHRDILPVSGTPRIRIELDARPDYARSNVAYEINGEYIKMASTSGSYNSFYLYTNLEKQSVVDGDVIELTSPSYLMLAYNEKLKPITKDRIFVEYEKTKTYWLDWVYRTEITQKYKKYVVRSAITLKLLTYQRSGAVVAAPTTSLPEIIGKERNWDYRYCWVRDGSMIVDLYARLGHVNSSTRFIQFIINRMLRKHENIAVMYGINGEKQLDEYELDHLAGYEDSKPVRIGNDAYTQKQNDLYGELIETVYTYFVLCPNEYSLSEEVWTLVRSLVREVKDHWKTTDSGIWEYRDRPAHYVHSKLMNWVAMDRAAKIAKHIKKPQYAEKWQALAYEIKEDILVNGWSDELESFTMAYGVNDLDAANLLMLHYGFLPKDDFRIVSTVKKTYEHLVHKDFTMRYSLHDDFGAPENAFLVCCFWMVNALYLIGEKDKARQMFDNILKCSNMHGLFAEDVEISTLRLTGNFPQGYSHLALIQTALLLETEYNWSDAFNKVSE